MVLAHSLIASVQWENAGHGCMLLYYSRIFEISIIFAALDVQIWGISPSQTGEKYIGYPCGSRLSETQWRPKWRPNGDPVETQLSRHILWPEEVWLKIK